MVSNVWKMTAKTPRRKSDTFTLNGNQFNFWAMRLKSRHDIFVCNVDFDSFVQVEYDKTFAKTLSFRFELDLALGSREHKLPARGYYIRGSFSEFV
jgi:hypothetical protein